MGWRFRKSVKLAPGVRVNFGKRGTSLSIGGKGFRKTFSSTGRTTTTFGIPGTGLSYSESSKKPKKKRSTKRSSRPKVSVRWEEPATSPTNKPGANKLGKVMHIIMHPSTKIYRICGIILQVASVLLLLMSLLLTLATPIGIVGVLLAFLFFFVGKGYRKKSAVPPEEQDSTKDVGTNDEENLKTV